MEPATKQKISKPNMMTENEGKESDADYDNDDFEKDDLVKMVEPNAQKAIANKRKQNLADRQTKESSQEAGSDSNSLLREISVRNKLENPKGSSSMPPTSKMIQ
jgi:hypothetical protein